MGIEKTLGIGNLYSIEDEQFVAEINYHLWEKPPVDHTDGKWWGDFIPKPRRHYLKGEYIIELNDKRRGKISIINIDICPGAPNFHRFNGKGLLE